MIYIDSFFTLNDSATLCWDRYAHNERKIRFKIIEK